MPVIKFSEEWDKLKPENRKPGTKFTTIRGYEARKEMYYWNLHNKCFDVHLKGKWVGIARLETLGFFRPSQLPTDFLEKDIRKGITEKEVCELFRSFYGNPDPYCIVLWFRWEAVQTYIDSGEDEEVRLSREKEPVRCEMCGGMAEYDDRIGCHYCPVCDDDIIIRDSREKEGEVLE